MKSLGEARKCVRSVIGEDIHSRVHTTCETVSVIGYCHSLNILCCISRVSKGIPFYEDGMKLK
jgi:hypothetical protein